MSSDPTAPTIVQSIIQQLFDQAIVPLTQLRAINYATAAVFTILVYDVLFTLSREIEYIWRTLWSIAKILYIIARYGGTIIVGVQLFVNTQQLSSKLYVSLIHNSSLSSNIRSCHVYIWVALLLPSISEWVVNAILMLRLHALYGRRRKYLIAFICIVIIDIAFQLWAVVRSVLMVGLVSSPLPISGCQFAPKTTSGAFTIPSILVAGLFFGLTIYKFYENATTTGEYSSFGWKDLSPVFLALLRDGTVIFFLVTAILIFGIIFLTTVHNALDDLILPCLTGTLSMAGSRLILKLREAAAGERLPTYGSSTEWNTSIQFQTRAVPTPLKDETGIETTEIH
ncbi:hypothetical protein M422DRAFT_257758 [Sphaerobolus stellatus SS14]|uniref:Unplaced genomic scaffold SPHSTscaffold_77, whole genome shotgun sequence n=1 Tax=Sphaerobolus stellatus (strain SS14) TaxID=990650 RepID=A0A0C9UX67_SPHS4|nr:hypothetical protein M422DRAFT_257758 [Sphaerobolus stellatus SS14]